MSKFEELAILAANYSRNFYADALQCSNAAKIVMTSYARYLECPIEKVDFLRLDKNLNRTADTSSFDDKVPLVLHIDGFRYFCGRILFDGADPRAYAHEVLPLGIKINDDDLTIREERDFQACLNDPASFEPFFDHLYKASVEGFNRKADLSCKRIGFY